MKKVTFVMKLEEFQELERLRERIVESQGFRLSVSELVRSVVLQRARLCAPLSEAAA